VADSSPSTRSLKLAVIGMSSSATCGVRDHAGVLAHALASENVSSSFHWLVRERSSLRGSRSEIRAWASGLSLELAESRPDAILLHYSVFSYSYKGLPLFVRPLMSALRASRLPVVGVLHELAYPWMYGGWRGRVWAISQRALLIEVMRTCAAVIVTADFRASWLTSRRWLAKRRVLVAPVFSTLPAPRVLRATPHTTPVIGVFGYSYEGAAVTLILDAVRGLRARGVRSELRLLGAPGRASAAGETWLQAADARGVGDDLSFSGTVPAQELSDALADCDLLLFADISGPSSRKTTLTASLASGAAVVAIDGARSWSQLVHSDAIRLVAPAAAALEDAIGELLADRAGREALGARGRTFAESEMGVERTATAVRRLLGEALSADRGDSPPVTTSAEAPTPSGPPRRR
jgi:glycosyltransferase involved in cell wall biosynthesis